ncbi:MAG: hypothetical protein V3T05_10145 [Myxococcota bacterium]
MMRWALPLVLVGIALSANAKPEETEEVKAVPAPEAKKPTAPLDDLVLDVPDSEKATESAEHITRMKEILSRVLKFLGDAREERDVVKLNCINEKLTAIKGLLRISEQADVSMQEALARRNPEVAQHEYEKIAISVSKCEQLFAESEACVGELAVYAGDTQVEVEITGEPPDLDIEETEVITRPPAASPYQ